MLEKINIIDHAQSKRIIGKNLLVSLGFSLSLFLITYLLYLDFSYMGIRNKEMEALVMSHYKMELMWIHLKILLAYLVIGLVTPPVGTTLFVASGVGNVKLASLVPFIMRFIWIMVIVQILIMFFPPITTWLPSFIK